MVGGNEDVKAYIYSVTYNREIIRWRRQDNDQYTSQLLLLRTRTHINTNNRVRESIFEHQLYNISIDPMIHISLI